MVAALLDGCKKGEFIEEMEIWPRPSDFPQEVGAEGGTYIVQIASNAIWMAEVSGSDEGDEKWIEISKTTGINNNDLRITVLPNNRMKERSDTVKITLSRSKEGFEIVVRQAKPDMVVPYLEVSSDNLGKLSNKPVDYNGISYPVEIKSNADWVVGNIPDWLVVTPSEGAEDARLTFEFAPNSSTEERYATLTISVGGKNVTKELSVDFYVEQRGAKSHTSLGVTPDTGFPDVPAEGGDEYIINISVESADVVWRIEGLPAWCVPERASGSGSDEIQLAISANPSKTGREAVIRIKAGDASERLYIYQDGTAKKPFEEEPDNEENP